MKTKDFIPFSNMVKKESLELLPKAFPLHLPLLLNVLKKEGIDNQDLSSVLDGLGDLPSKPETCRNIIYSILLGDLLEVVDYKEAAEFFFRHYELLENTSYQKYQEVYREIIAKGNDNSLKDDYPGLSGYLICFLRKEKDKHSFIERRMFDFAISYIGQKRNDLSRIIKESGLKANDPFSVESPKDIDIETIVNHQ